MLGMRCDARIRGLPRFEQNVNQIVSVVCDWTPTMLNNDSETIMFAVYEQNKASARDRIGDLLQFR